jgi:hypothetical protein
VHDWVCLNVQVAEHGIGLSVSQKVNDVVIGLGGLPWHRMPVMSGLRYRLRPIRLPDPCYGWRDGG